MSVDTHNIDFFGDFSAIRHVVGNHGSLAEALHVHTSTLGSTGIAQGLQNHHVCRVHLVWTRCFTESPLAIYDGSTPRSKDSTRNAHHIQRVGRVAFMSCFVHNGDEHGTTFSGQRVLSGTFKFKVLRLRRRQKTFRAGTYRKLAFLAAVRSDTVFVGRSGPNIMSLSAKKGIDSRFGDTE